MKSVQGPHTKQSKTDRSLQRKLGILDQRFRLQEQNTKRRRIGQSVTAGHVRGGHAFH